MEANGFMVIILFTQVKKEEPSDSCKAEPMETSVSGEDRKPEVKSEAKEEEEGSGTAGTNSSPAAAQNKKKSMSNLAHSLHRSFVLDTCAGVDRDRRAYCT